MPGSTEAPATLVVGLVLTIDSSPARQSRALELLTAFPGLRLGVPCHPVGGATGSGLPPTSYLAATAESTDPRSLHRALESIPGVRAVDAVFVEVSSDDAKPGPVDSREAVRRHRNDEDYVGMPGPDDSFSPDTLSPSAARRMSAP